MKTLFAALLLVPGLAFAQTETAKTTPASPVATAPIKISLDARGEDVREVLATLFSEAKKPYALDAAIKGKLYVKIDAMPYDKALAIVLTQSGLLAKERDGVVLISVAPAPSATTVTKAVAKPVVAPKPIEKPAAVKPEDAKPTEITPATYARKVTTRMTKAALTDVFAALATQAEVTIEVDPKVPAYKIDAFFVKTSLRYALNRVCKAAGLKYLAADGKITITVE